MADDDNDRVLETAVKNVKKNAWHMKRAMDLDSLKDVLQHAANMLFELRTSLLTPRNYYQLYMAVADELMHLEHFFSDLHKKGTPMEDLYRMVQHAGNVLPRLYLLVTAGSVYIKSKEVPAKEILKDVVEMAKGVQHPMRGLFLRNYVSHMTKDKLPDTDNDYHGDGGTVQNSIDFVLQNFSEMNKLWVRMQFQRKHGTRVKREKQRQQLKVLVGTNLHRLSDLEGLDVDLYKANVLPRILEQITNCKDAIAQEYLMEIIVQVFPSEFHLRTLELYLSTCSTLDDKVDVKSIMSKLMDRLATYAVEHEIPSDNPVFEIFNTQVAKVIKSKPKMGLPDMLSLQLSLVRFALRCATSEDERFTYADKVLGFCAQLLRSAVGEKVENSDCADKVVMLLNTVLESLVLGVLDPKVAQFEDMLKCLQWKHRAVVAAKLLRSVIQKPSKALSEPKLVDRLFRFLAPLITDPKDPNDNIKKSDEEFKAEQQLVGRLVHKFQNSNPDVLFKIYNVARKYFGRGGKTRIKYTLVPLVFAILRLARRMGDLIRRGKKPSTNIKKLFQFVHEMVTALGSQNPAHGEISLQLFLHGAQLADYFGFKSIAYEFMTKSFILYEDLGNDHKAQIRSINLIAGTMYQCTKFSKEDCENLITRITQSSAKLLKKPDQCRMVQVCCHLFWATKPKKKKNYQNEKRVLECLQRSLKIADVCMASSMHLQLFVEILNEYLIFFERKCPTITWKYLDGLVELINEHMNTQEAPDPATKKFYSNTLEYIRKKQASDPRYKSIRV